MNRTLTQMRQRVRRLAHDLHTATGEKTYSDPDVDVALEDALGELTDRLLADDLGRWALVKESEGVVVETAGAAAAIALPEDCLRLEQVRRMDAEGQWRMVRRAGCDWPGKMGMAGSRETSVELGYRVLAVTDGGGKVWEPDEVGSFIRLRPWGTGDAETIRFVYLAAPEWAGTATSRLALPDGADQLVELMAADGLTADEPRDEKRMAIYRARVDGRYQRWVQGRARGKVDRGQKVAGA